MCTLLVIHILSIVVVHNSAVLNFDNNDYGLSWMVMLVKQLSQSLVHFSVKLEQMLERVKLKLAMKKLIG